MEETPTTTGSSGSSGPRPDGEDGDHGQTQTPINSEDRAAAAQESEQCAKDRSEGEDDEQLRKSLAQIASASAQQRVARVSLFDSAHANADTQLLTPAPKPSTSTTAAMATTTLPTDSNHPILFRGVRGFDERRNDVIYYPPDKSRTTSAGASDVDGIEYGGEGGEKVLIFFGGDIQDLALNMLNSPYVNYSLESTASMLHSQLPSHHILVIRPSTFKSPYSCYDNFVPSSPAHTSGIPEHTANHNALSHLEQLLRGVSRLYNGGGGAGTQESEEHQVVSSTTNELDLANGKISLVGFSKGSVVLNQLLYEFHFYKTLHPESPPRFLSTIRHLYWLDGGHGGGKNTWITARPILDTLSRLEIRIHVHMTPYQLNDDRRPYIRNEEKLFGSTLARLGVEIERRVWFEGEPSLEAHFGLIGAVFAKRSSASVSAENL